MTTLQRMIAIDCNQIVDDESFHSVFAKAFGFPPFYGRNMDAWIDYMTRLDEDFSTVRVCPRQVVVIGLKIAKSLQRRLPRLWGTFIDCAAFVNFRRTERSEPVLLALSWT